VKIGDQTWMAENLRVTHLNDGTEISGPGNFCRDYWCFQAGENDTTWYLYGPHGYTYYDLEESNLKNYGVLYGSGSVKSGKLCPSGWHVSTHQDWDVLESYLGGDSIAGGKLKNRGTKYWNNPNTGATNETGFSAWPGGTVHTHDDPFRNWFYGINEISYFWSPDPNKPETEEEFYNSWWSEAFPFSWDAYVQSVEDWWGVVRILSSANEAVSTRIIWRQYWPANNSVRCVKD
jgi:uncharacterized protein (TIGR02145 family)